MSSVIANGKIVFTFTFFSPSQPANAPVPIAFKVAGISNVSIFVQFSKALTPIDSIVSEKVTAVIAVPLYNSSGIDFSEVGSLYFVFGNHNLKEYDLFHRPSNPELGQPTIPVSTGKFAVSIFWS